MQKEQTKTFINNRAFLVSLLILRVALGSLFLEAGFRKLFSGEFSAIGLLSHATGPFSEFFIGIAANSNLINTINILVIVGEIAIGVMLLSGFLVRLASFLASLMMVLYYLPTIPPSNGWISQHIIYFILLVSFMISGAGYFFGVDRLFFKFQETKHWIRFFLG